MTHPVFSPLPSFSGLDLFGAGILTSRRLTLRVVPVFDFVLDDAAEAGRRWLRRVLRRPFSAE